MGFVLTRSAELGWKHYCEVRPGYDHPSLYEVIQKSKPIPRPEGLSDDNAVAYQHPEYRAIFFVVKTNPDEELVVLGIRTIRAKKKPIIKQSTSEPTQMVWDEMPGFVNDHDIISWCINQNAIAYGRIASGENKAQCNARINQIAIIRKQAGQRMANAPKAVQPRRVNNRDDYEIGRDRERGDVINFLKASDCSDCGYLIQQFFAGAHRSTDKKD